MATNTKQPKRKTTKSKRHLLETNNVKLWYGKKEALHGITLDYAQRGITALIGPSGSGKSTYLRAINRMHDLQADVTVQGEFLLNGENIYAPTYDTVELRKKVGMVFQQPNPFPFSIYDNVAFGLRLEGKADKSILDEKVETALKQAAVWDEVKDRLNVNALSLSGGQQQRISVARALATSPEVLLLDEPTSALDPISSHVVEESLMQLRDKYAMIIVTHNMQQAARVSDRTAFFMDGSLIEVDDTKKIFLDPQEKATQDYVSGRFG